MNFRKSFPSALAIILLAMSTISCTKIVKSASSYLGGKVIATGPITTEHRVLTPISGINASTGLTLVYIPSDSLSLTVSAPSDVIDLVTTTVSDHCLYVSLSKNVHSTGPISVTVSAPSVTDFSASASASVKIDGLLIIPEADFTAQSSSGASFTADSIKAASADVISSSGAALSVGNLTCGALTANSSTGASVAVRCITTTADLTASSGASLAIAGTTDTANLTASSGASISASDLHAKEGSSNASSGSSITSAITSPSSATTNSGATISNKSVQ